jgi:hypothetical protein
MIEQQWVRQADKERRFRLHWPEAHYRAPVAAGRACTAQSARVVPPDHPRDTEPNQSATARHVRQRVPFARKAHSPVIQIKHVADRVGTVWSVHPAPLIADSHGPTPHAHTPRSTCPVLVFSERTHCRRCGGRIRRRLHAHRDGVAHDTARSDGAGAVREPAAAGCALALHRDRLRVDGRAGRRLSDRAYRDRRVKR